MSLNWSSSKKQSPFLQYQDEVVVFVIIHGGYILISPSLFPRKELRPKIFLTPQFNIFSAQLFSYY